LHSFVLIQVENVDIRTGPNALGTTYPVSKFIFIGAKETHAKSNTIKGVLMHEIVHYVMRLVYENNENPYYNNDKKSYEEFDNICKSINKWTVEDDIFVNEIGDQIEDIPIIVDVQDEEYPDDECEGIISTVYTLYNMCDYHPELIVRPLQILAQYQGDEEKINHLQEKYKNLYDYVSNKVVNELEKFSLRERSLSRSINKQAKVLPDIKRKVHEFKTSKIDESLIDEKYSLVTTNVPKFLLHNIYQLLKNEYLLDTKNIFISSKICENKDLFTTLKKVLAEIQELKVIVDCSVEIELKVIDLVKENANKFIFIISDKQNYDEFKNKLQLEIQNEITPTQVDYAFKDLNIEIQQQLLKATINFQNIANISLWNLLSIQSISGEDISQAIHVDNELLNLLVNGSSISIDTQPKDENDGQDFKFLFQDRKLIKNDQTELLDYLNLSSILISDYSGTGKSWKLQNISDDLRIKHIDKLVIYIDCKKYNQVFKQTESEFNLSKFIEQKVLCLKRDFELKIFEKAYTNGKVCILFDGFDDFPEYSFESVIKCLKSFEPNSGNQLWVTTREDLRSTLEADMAFEAICKLDTFTEQNGINLISKTHGFNHHKNETKTHTEDFKKLIENSDVTKKFRSFAEKLCKNISEICNHSIDLPQFYHHVATFIDDKNMTENCMIFEIFHEFAQTQCKKIADKVGRTNMEIHQKFAMDLDDDTRQIFSSEYKDCAHSESAVRNCGLMIKHGDEFVFQHDIFKEYFIADYIVNRALKKHTKDERFVNFVIKILTLSKFKAVRMFLNSALTKKITMDVFKEIIKNHSESFASNLEDIFSKVFKESLENVASLHISILKGCCYEKIKDLLNHYIKYLIKETTDTNMFLNYQELIIDFFTVEDAKDFIVKNEVLQNIICSKLDMKIINDLVKKLDDKIDSNFVRRVLKQTECGTKRNNVHLLFTSREYDEIFFQQFFEILCKFLTDNEIIKIFKEFDGLGMNLLHICVDTRNKEKLEFIWEKIKKSFLNEQDNNRHQEYVMKISDQMHSNVFHLVASCDQFEFHKTLWALMLGTIDEENIMCLLKEEDKKGYNFFNILFQQNEGIVEETLKLIKHKFTPKTLRNVLECKNKKKEQNLLHIILVESKNVKMHETLWTFVCSIFKDDKEFAQFLINTDDEGNNILQLAIIWSTEQIFNFIIGELEKIPSNIKDPLIINVLVNNSNNQKQNILHLLTMSCKDKNFHEIVWKVILKYQDSNEKNKLIKSVDSSEYKFFSYLLQTNPKDIVSFTWKYIEESIPSNEEQHVYFYEHETEREAMYNMSLENNDNPEVFIWFDQLLSKFNFIFQQYYINLLKLVCIFHIGKLSKKHLHGMGENILKFVRNKPVQVEIDPLEKMLNHEDVKDRKIVSLIMSGFHRGGKSYFLNYCLRYLYAHVSNSI